MTIITAEVATDFASRYLQQLAKHWAHRFDVRFTPEEATIALPFGRCDLRAVPGVLTLILTPDLDADIERFKTVVADHLQRFGHRETLTFDWREA